MLVCELWHGREARCGHRCDAFFGPCGLEKGVARSVSRPKTSSAMALEDREATEMQPLEEGSEATVTEQQAESDFEEGHSEAVEAKGAFGAAMTTLQMSSQEVTVLRTTFDMRLE